MFRMAILGIVLLFGAAPASVEHSHYLFTWGMEVRHPDAPMSGMASIGHDFVGVFNVDPDAAPFGTLVAMLPVGTGAKMAHHTSYELPPDSVLFANDWLANRTYMVDVHDPKAPRLVAQFGTLDGYMYPHSFVHLSNGDTLATFQYTRGYNRAPGGLVELDAHGHVVKASSATNARIDPNIRPYSLAIVERLNRVVTSSADMMGAQTSHVAQVWRLSDLKLLDTIVLPKTTNWYEDAAADSSEPRLLADGTTVIVPTFNCGLYAMQHLASSHPTILHVYDLGYRSCEVPLVVGSYLVEAAQSGHAIVALDVHDPLHPREVGRVLLGADEAPHWLAIEPRGDRIVITGYGALKTYARFATIDRDTGALTLDSEKIDFKRAWPDGWDGPAVPHGAVFSNAAGT